MSPDQKQTEETDDLRLGSLLRSFGLIKETDLERALSVSTQTRLPVGKILVMNEKLSDVMLKSVVDAQWMLRDRLLTVQQASTAMGIAQRNNWTLSDSMVLMGCDAYRTKGARLGELLLGAQAIPEDDLNLVLNAANSSGLPLGRILVLLDRVPSELLGVALRLQREVRLSKIESKDAIAELKTINNSVLPIEVNGSKLGDLLLAARVLNQSEVDVAVQMSQANSKLFGELIIEFGWVRSDVVEAALAVQRLVRANQVPINDAVSVLKDVANGGQTVELAIKNAGLTPTDLEKGVSLYEFLRLTGFLSGARLQEIIREIVSETSLASYVLQRATHLSGSKQTSLKDAIKIAIENSDFLAELLLKTEVSNKELIAQALSLQKDLKSGSIKLDHALIKFACFRTGCAALCR